VVVEAGKAVPRRGSNGNGPPIVPNGLKEPSSVTGAKEPDIDTGQKDSNNGAGHTGKGDAKSHRDQKDPKSDAGRKGSKSEGKKPSKEHTGGTTPTGDPASASTDRPSGSKELDAIAPPAAIWQWEHKTGFRDYELLASVKIEKAYQEGWSFVQLKSGKTKTVPMEIFFADMLQYDPVTGNTRNVKRVGDNGIKTKLNRYIHEVLYSLETGKPRGLSFKQYANARTQLFMKGGEILITVRGEKSLYKKEGRAQAVARSRTFFVLSMTAVLLNAVWMGLDAEFNDAQSIPESKWYFQVGEHLFCAFFTGELVIRLSAFEQKWNCRKDRWFIFDAVLVSAQVLETWVLLVLLSGQRLKFIGVVKLARLLRLARLGRLLRMLRLFPEVLTLLKGISRAMSSVFYVFVMLMVLLFLFAILFKTQTFGNDVLSGLFPSILDSMWLLLLSGTLLDSPAREFFILWGDSTGLALLYLIFIFLSCFTVLNMLIGILCEVVVQVSKDEQEEATLNRLKSTWISLLECYDRDDDHHIGKAEFELLMQNPETGQILRRFDVDAAGLRAMKEILFDPPTKKLSFAELLEAILRLRGGISATVTDVVDVREYVKLRCDTIERQLTESVNQQISGIQDMLSRVMAAQGLPPETDDEASAVAVS